MVVVPTQAHVHMYYGDTPVETTGNGLSALGLAVLVLPGVAAGIRRFRDAR
jgi:hypothetical protein